MTTLAQDIAAACEAEGVRFERICRATKRLPSRERSIRNDQRCRVWLRLLRGGMSAKQIGPAFGVGAATVLLATRPFRSRIKAKPRGPSLAERIEAERAVAARVVLSLLPEYPGAWVCGPSGALCKSVAARRKQDAMLTRLYMVCQRTSVLADVLGVSQTWVLAATSRLGLRTRAGSARQEAA